MPEPALELTYHFDGDGTNHIWGVCFDVPSAAACNPSQNFVYSSRADSPVVAPNGGWAAGPDGFLRKNEGGFDHVVIPLPSTGTHTVVVFFDTVGATTAGQNAVSGLFIDEVAYRSDIDLDGRGENSPLTCDKCIDRDGDGFGEATAFALLDTCDADAAGLDEVRVDCDDNDPDAKPSAGTEDSLNACYREGDSPQFKDNNCDGLLDTEDPDCAECGNGSIDIGETCDDGQPIPTSGDGCSDTCQVETDELYLSEVHLPIIFGASGEQWIEVYNGTSATFDFAALDLGVVIGDRCPTDAQGAVLDRYPFDDTRDNLDGSADPAKRCSAMGFSGDDALCTATSPLQILPGNYFVINFGPRADSGIDDGTKLDASCLSPIAMSPLGDVVSILLKTGPTEWELTDRVDFRRPVPNPSNLWSCELLNYRSEVGRSFMLKAPTASNGTANDHPDAWCLAGPLADNRYSSSDRHYGSPGEAGSCGELACDGVDDDCDGTVAQPNPDNIAPGTVATVGPDDSITVTPPEAILFDADGDGVCNQVGADGSIGGADCQPLIPTCSGGIECTRDLDGDDVIDCADGCQDVDGDGYGTSNASVAAHPTCASSGRCAPVCSTGTDCNDTSLDSFPGNTAEGSFDVGNKCRDGLDQDCDGRLDCRDSGCESQTQCAGETCAASAVTLSCGEVVSNVSPFSSDFVNCLPDTANGKDKVYRFTPTINGDVNIFFENLGNVRYSARYYETTCAEDTCPSADPADPHVVDSNCVSGGTLTIKNASKTKLYYVVLKQVGTCSNGQTPFARVRVACAEDCVTPGQD